MSTSRNQNEFHGSERELLALTSDLDQLNNDVGMPAMWDGVANMVDSMNEQSSFAAQQRRVSPGGTQG